MHDDRLFTRPLRRDPLVWVWAACVLLAALGAASRYVDPGAPFNPVLALAFTWEILVAAFWVLALLLVLAWLRRLVRRGWRRRQPGPPLSTGSPVEQVPSSWQAAEVGTRSHDGVTLPPTVTAGSCAGHPLGDLRLLTVTGRTVRHDEPLRVDWHVPDADQVLVDGVPLSTTGHVDLLLGTSRDVVVQAFTGDRLLRSVTLPVTVLPPPVVDDWLGPPAAALESAVGARPLFSSPLPAATAELDVEGAPRA